MKQLLALTLLFSCFSFTFALPLPLPIAEMPDYGDCVSSAGDTYTQRETVALEKYRTAMKSLEYEKGEQVKTHFTILSIRASLSKIQNVRSEHRAKVLILDSELKKRISEIKSDYEIQIELCQNEKRKMGDDASL